MEEGGEGKGAAGGASPIGRSGAGGAEAHAKMRIAVSSKAPFR